MYVIDSIIVKLCGVFSCSITSTILEELLPIKIKKHVGEENEGLHDCFIIDTSNCMTVKNIT